MCLISPTLALYLPIKSMQVPLLANIDSKQFRFEVAAGRI
jgi:hypothetical protein